MKRRVSKVPMDTNKFRIRVFLEDEPTPMTAQDAKAIQLKFLLALAEQPILLACEAHLFQKLTIWHNGHSWVAEAEAIVTEEA